MHVLAQGTGQALDTARRGDADLVLVHDPEAEQKFIDEGHGVNRRQIAWNDFHPCRTRCRSGQDQGRHTMPSPRSRRSRRRRRRSSRAATAAARNALELRLWKAAAIDPKSGAGSWYREIGGGMGQALNAASAMPAYTLSDRGTWLSFKNKGPLVVVVEGDPLLINRYDVIELNPKTHSGAKLDAAHRSRRLACRARRTEGDRRVPGRRRTALSPLRRRAALTVGARLPERKAAHLGSQP